MTAITKTIRARPAEVKTWKSRLSADGPEVTQIRVKISSTAEDRDGDEFSLAGLESMLPTLKSGKVPYYLDHGLTEQGVTRYGALDMIGAWINGEIVGNALYATAFIEPGNVAGETLARKIGAGLPVGHSVGFMSTKTRPKPNGGLIFDAVSLLEVSAVGIPSNPDAVTAALKSIRAAAGLGKKRAAGKTERILLVRMADGSRKCITETKFRAALRAALDDKLAPVMEDLKQMAAAAGQVRSIMNPPSVQTGKNRGKTMRRMVTANYGEVV